MRKVKTFKDFDFDNKRVLFRADFNVPLDENLKIRDSSRINRTLPTLKCLLEGGAAVTLCSHLGRPKGEVKPEFSLKPVFHYLKEVLPQNKIFFAEEYIPHEKVTTLPGPSQVLLLENLRFHKGETKNHEDFAKELAKFGELFVLDAFGTAHRAHASTFGVQQFLPSAVGMLVEKEVIFLEEVVNSQTKPFIAILGGAKISGKIDVIENLLPRVDKILIGGGMAYTFLKAQGKEIGKSLLEDEKITLAANLLKSGKIEIPSDHVVSSSPDNKDAVTCTEIPSDKMALDIGPETLKEFKKYIKDASLIFWNGPVGFFEKEPFGKGTEEIARAIAGAKGKSVVGGGDSVAAIEKYGITEGFDHLSTGGGASLEYVEGKTLPALEKLYI
ncbi:phosphoglycerate kinase [Candidatus Riflebacteria bacterium]